MRTDPSHRRGARGLRAEDWPFGSVGRRRLLGFVLGADESPPWSKRELERAAGTAAGGVDRVIAELLHWRLLEQRADGYWPVRPKSALARALDQVMQLVAGDTRRIPPLARGPRGRPRRTPDAPG